MASSNNNDNQTTPTEEAMRALVRRRERYTQLEEARAKQFEKEREKARKVSAAVRLHQHYSNRIH